VGYLIFYLFLSASIGGTASSIVDGSEKNDHIIGVCYALLLSYASCILSYASCVPPSALNIVPPFLEGASFKYREGGVKSPTSNRIAKITDRCAIAFLSAHIPCPLLALTGKRGKKLGMG
jgi:hypothetical protein